MKMSIHRTAIIAGGARLGEGVKIGPFTVRGENVEIGDGPGIGSFVHLDGWTIIGRNNIIKDHVSIGHAPQYLNYNNEKTYVVI
ncbi:MAG: acyl-[acyl-carrier-protein]--UDP-N-acetylglucosamine O-acyltransferase, partial [Acetomicrobium sp.]